tara:strand:+ start:189 stop:416 length:228 start_codon:yes stop_codon:yes gene_type:complete
LKYANSASIEINIDQEGELIQISIIYDGQGFDLDNSKFGTGVRGMKSRAMEAGANFDLKYTTKQGTQVLLTFTIN